MHPLPLPTEADRPFAVPVTARHRSQTAGSAAGIAVGIDVGGTKIAAGIVGADGALGATHRVATPTTPDGLLEAIVEMARAICPDDGPLPVGCGYPGMVDRAGAIIAGPNVALSDFPLAEELQLRLGVPVVVENDAAAATWAEFRVGGGASATADMAMLTLGTGVGGGLVLGGRLFRGAHGFAAEVGHLVHRTGGRVGPSGIPGEVEAYCSGTALRSLAVEAVAEGRAAPGSRLRDVRRLNAAVIVQAARDGDALAAALLEDLACDLGVAMANIVNLLDVEAIVVGGGLGEADDLILPVARRAMQAHLLGASRRPEVPVQPAALGTTAGIIGAGLLAAERS